MDGQVYAHLRVDDALDHDTDGEGMDDDGQSPRRTDGEMESEIDDALEADDLEVDTFLAYVYKREKGEADEQFRVGRITVIDGELVTF
jgi:hypothetical protein